MDGVEKIAPVRRTREEDESRRFSLSIPTDKDASAHGKGDSHEPIKSSQVKFGW